MDELAIKTISFAKVNYRLNKKINSVINWDATISKIHEEINTNTKISKRLQKSVKNS